MTIENMRYHTPESCRSMLACASPKEIFKRARIDHYLAKIDKELQRMKILEMCEAPTEAQA